MRTEQPDASKDNHNNQNHKDDDTIRTDKPDENLDDLND